MSEEQLLVRALKGELTDRVPFWFMRQAGRYLPEYRELRATAKDFLDLCYSPEKASEITIQPIRRFGMDAAILFSDILVIPDALGVDVRFEQGEGPVVEQTITPERIAVLRLGDVREKLTPVIETVKLTRRDLPPQTSLIGFAGSPWTVACYMLEGPRKKKEFETARRFAYREPELMQKLIDTLTDATIDYLRYQIESGVNAVQLFDSWSGLLSPAQFERWVIAPTKKIVAALRAAHGEFPIIGFAKGAGANLAAYAAQTGVNAIGVDQHTPMPFAIAQRAHTKQAVQGNLDPLLVVSDGPAAAAQAATILDQMRGVPCVFNLGHGFIPETPIENVAAVCETIKNFRRN